MSEKIEKFAKKFVDSRGETAHKSRRAALRKRFGAGAWKRKIFENEKKELTSAEKNRITRCRRDAAGSLKSEERVGKLEL